MSARGETISRGERPALRANQNVHSSSAAVMAGKRHGVHVARLLISREAARHDDDRLGISLKLSVTARWMSRLVGPLSFVSPLFAKGRRIFDMAGAFQSSLKGLRSFFPLTQHFVVPAALLVLG